MKHGWAAALVLLAAVAWAQAPDPSSLVRALLPAESWSGTAPPTPPVTLKEHVAALRGDALHGQAFKVLLTHGPDDARRVVVVVPQFHRSPLLPLLWNSIGEAIAGVQENVDILTTRLVEAHGLRCVGTEGSWADRIPRSEEQLQLASAVAELDRAAAGIHKMDAALGEDARRVKEVLQPYMARQAITLDGVGASLWRLGRADVARFGLEEEALNKKALDLLAQMRKLEEALARLEPEEQAPMEDTMAQTWREEFPAFSRDVVEPLQAALTRLDAARLRALKDGVEMDAAVLGRFVKLARTLTDEVLRVADVTSYNAYYLEVGRTPEATPKPSKPPTRAQRAKAAALRKKLEPLQARYEKTAGALREEAAVRRVLQRLAAPQGVCLLVMGANHQDGVLAALQRQGSGVGVVVVEPYAVEEPGAADGGTPP